MKKLWSKIKKFWKQTWKELKDWKTLILYIIVNIVLSCEIWVPYLLGLITGNKWWYGIGSACWLFWIGPGTPFIPLCIAITLAIKKIFFKKKDEKK